MLKNLPLHLKLAYAQNLNSVLNATKWNELFLVLEPMQETLDFRRKDLRWRELPNWDGDIYHVFGLSQFIEWMDIRPSDHGKLVDAVSQLGVPFEEVEVGIRVYGYTSSGSSSVSP